MYIKFVRDNKTVAEVSVKPELIPTIGDNVVLESGTYEVQERVIDILDGSIKVILGTQILFTGTDPDYNRVMNAFIRRYGSHIELSHTDFMTMKSYLPDNKLQAVKHVKEAARVGLKDAKDFVDLYCELS